MMSTMDELRTIAEEKIELAARKFPPSQKGGRKLPVASPIQMGATTIQEVFEGKRWQDLIPVLVKEPYYFTGLDWVEVFTDKASRYYMPAFFMAALERPEILYWNSEPYFVHRLADETERLSIKEVEAVVAFYEFHAEYWRIKVREGIEWYEHADLTDHEALRWMAELEKRRKAPEKE